MPTTTRVTATAAAAVNVTTGKHPLTTSFTPPLTMPIATTTLSGEDEDNDHGSLSVDDGNGSGRHPLITSSTAQH